MFILELIPWAASFVVLGAMLFLARSAFRAGEFAGRPRIEPPAPEQPSREASSLPE